ncbi:hypothetical protein LU689_26180 [Pseudomonas asiatica]|uniref:hypothetical protein n=1 Tax=Pseudomonas TaxID=286 RepID=UPI0012DA16D6|nr:MULTISPECIES: hypothetical protein [Pseudomonas]MCE0755578.1 hypothetical protein [Pseudomonas asiatica]MCE0853394.1 hypothetical protein [Pseudomonas asiatica]MCE0981572.1 hypothetical protein [Pseudomonas monteilii]URD45366.1 hypothetical protein M6G63_27015 [Pseudomonas sp. BYT-5]URL00776.1 hypothetical protein J5X93_26255 [Pseudomonas sp. BYT-1]
MSILIRANGLVLLTILLQQGGGSSCWVWLIPQALGQHRGNAMPSFIAIKANCTVPEETHVQAVLKEHGRTGLLYPRIIEDVPRSVRQYFEPIPLGSDAVSVFSNEVEPLSARRGAAASLGKALEGLQESAVRGPVRTARIKCELAAQFGKSHGELSDRYCEVSELLHKGGVNVYSGNKWI